MASGLFALLDDIAALMDDVAVMTKVAGKKTAAILGDDLAVNAQKASGFAASRELPVIWEITKGSLINKLIVLPLVFLLDYFYPPLIHWLLVVGGLYLAFEGAEKILEWLFHSHSAHQRPQLQDSPEAILAKERKKIRSAILTDLILSLEIVIIAISAVGDQELAVKVLSVSLVAFLATIGIYGLVALIVRLDDMGVALIQWGWESVGKALIWLLPRIIKALSILGTLAMLLVAGGIFLHQLPLLEELFHSWPPILAELLLGFGVGVVLVGIVTLAKKIKFS
ncbi:MAG: DUF808 domain-containing protein [Nitratiruptor sp.]|nr:DUF808 domain-containing protein [Nitratiruptor sp.]NPA83756.1 DUF808 domain-containing protein [Campylobacterota bacterium]